jgi:DNA-binding MarR family transcriptional regulator
MPDETLSVYFRFFNEIGILEQLGRALLEARLPSGFILPHFAVLNHLIRVKDGQTPMALARAFQVPKTNMTHSLAKLAKAGLIELRPNPKDGRSKYVFITPAGFEFRQKAIVALMPDIEKISLSIKPDQIASLLPMLEDIRRHLDHARD